MKTYEYLRVRKRFFENAVKKKKKMEIRQNHLT